MIWFVAFMISLVLTVGMGAFFVLMSLIALNGFMSMEAAMPTYLAFNCFAWPLMVGVTTLATWLLFVLTKRQRPFAKILLLNVATVTTFLALAALVLYFG
jgi:hypothetical protein